MSFTHAAIPPMPLSRPSAARGSGEPAVTELAGARLAAGLRRKDPAAIREMHETHGGRVLAFLVQALGDRATAEDVCQEVFLEAWRKGSRYDPRRAGPGTWLMTIARSRAIDQLRRRVPEPDEDLTRGEGRADTEDPGARVEALHERWRMAAYLDRLPPEQAGVLRMRFHAGMSQSEIAETTGLPLGTVKTRMAGALNRLREMVDEEDGS
jgi:RNA polymerase sigma-70 factor (ECF subfamily)